ncbi:acetyltransferase [Brevibacillus dissolubilis]|uniref:acetyltransferase n=1 Tax=Brevibacillus dissolubilis TaxID=1844116 RepID=UPI0011171BDB|nr:acetyltransferase [Brevibacillus dissolubilis]
MAELIIIGAGGHARETAQLVKDLNRVQPTWELLGYVDDNPALQGSIQNGFPVLGPLDELLNQSTYNRAQFIVAIGNSQVRRRMIARLRETYPQLTYATLIHPTAVIGDETVIGAGTMIAANSVVTTNISIGEHVIINYGCTIGHDSKLENFATILPGCNLSGNVTIREAADIGTGCAVIPSVEIGEATVVGAGAVVTRSLPAYCTAVGVPAKPIKFSKMERE